MRPQTVDENLFDGLAARRGTSLVSIVIPTHERGREVTQDPIRFKNQVSRIDEELESLGWRRRKRAAHLQGAKDLVDDREFWEHQGPGLAFYLADDGASWAIALGHRPEPAFWIMPTFAVRPLLMELTAVELDALALSRGLVGLYTVSARSVRRVDADLPASFDDVNWFVDRETQRQQHPDRVGSDRNRHGHDPRSQEHEDLARFLREVDRALPPGPRELPLVVLGDDDLVARFANITDRDTTSPNRSGFPTSVSDEQIRDMAKPIVEDAEQERTNRFITKAVDRAGSGQGTSQITEAIRAALSGRVELLITDIGADPIWGRIDEATHRVTVTEDRGADDVDLLDRLVVLTTSNGGDVYGVMDAVDGHPFIATYRY
ncbi:MAG: hypothetical protein R2823_04945 [Acidimicrobiia bacterium]